MENDQFISAVRQELEAEYTASKKCLERIPVSLYEFKPHPTSINMGYLTLLVAEIPLWIIYIVEKSEIDFARFPHFLANTAEEMVAHLKADSCYGLFGLPG